jgi:hypothetical protein
MLDLYNNNYDTKVLLEHIYAINLLDILKTQTIDATFASRYILNKNFQLTKEEEEITPELVLFYQPHISKDELYNKFYTHEVFDSSFIDFETFSKRN